jgi:hypothetical protein
MRLHVHGAPTLGVNGSPPAGVGLQEEGVFGITSEHSGTPFEDHPPCTFYCGGGLHADLAYWDDVGWSLEEVRAVWRRHGVHVVRISAAPEAPPRPGVAAHLVYWRPLYS